MARNKNPAAVKLGRMGGRVTADKLTARQKSEIGRQNVMKRWHPEGEKAKKGARANGR